MCVDFQQLVWFSKNSSRRTGQIDSHRCLALTILFISVQIVCISFVLSTRMSAKIDVSRVVTTIWTRYFRRTHNKLFAEKRKTIYRLIICSSYWGVLGRLFSFVQCIYLWCYAEWRGRRQLIWSPTGSMTTVVSEIFKKIYIYLLRECLSAVEQILINHSNSTFFKTKIHKYWFEKTVKYFNKSEFNLTFLHINNYI